MQYKQYISAALVVIAAIIIFSSQIRISDIQSLVKSAGIFAPIVFILLHSLTYIVAPISGTPFWLAGYPLFGDRFILYAYIASILGMTANFWIARFWGRKIVIKMTGEKNMARIDEFSKLYGVKALVFLRLFQGNFADFISYAYGLTKIRFSIYFIISILAPIPWLLLWWFVLLPQIDSYREFIVSLVLSVIPLTITSILLAIYLRRKKSLKDA